MNIFREDDVYRHIRFSQPGTETIAGYTAPQPRTAMTNPPPDLIDWRSK